MVRSGLRFEIFCSKVVSNWGGKKVFFLHFFILFTFEVPFKHFFATFSKVGCPKFLEI